MNELGIYRPGHSFLHRLPAGAKLVGLFVLAVVMWLVIRIWWLALVLLALVVVLYFGCGFKMKTVWRQIRPMVLILAFMLVANWIARDFAWSVGVVASICALVLAAALVTLTTKTLDMVETVVRFSRPLRRFGVDPERIGLAMALGIRCVPLVAGLARQVREAQIARGNLKSIRAFATPLLVSAIHFAGDMGDALIARGVDD